MRYPLQDLVCLVRLAGNQIAAEGTLRPSDDQARVRLGVSSQAWRRFHAEGLTAAQADVLAVRAGFHPMNVWPDWPGEPPADCEVCGEGFHPRNERNLTCSPPCRKELRRFRDRDRLQRKAAA